MKYGRDFDTKCNSGNEKSQEKQPKLWTLSTKDTTPSEARFKLGTAVAVFQALVD